MVFYCYRVCIRQAVCQVVLRGGKGKARSVEQPGCYGMKQDLYQNGAKVRQAGSVL